ncbi:MipA/OmpV family protein [Varunaivibrio sulfuroxidans]
MLTRHWNIDATGAITRLVGDAGRGPLVEKRIQPLAMVSLNYTF